MSQKLTYADAGVDYGLIDEFKRAALRTSEGTQYNCKRQGYQEISSSRGEPTFLTDIGDVYLAHTIETLGTKSLVADEMCRLDSISIYYQAIGIDLVAAVVNDVITAGALPISFAVFLGTGDSKLFNDT